MFPPNIYGLLDEYKNHYLIENRIVAKIIDNLNDRKGIKQILQEIDGRTMEEIFSDLAIAVKEILEAETNKP